MIDTSDTIAPCRRCDGSPCRCTVFLECNACGFEYDCEAGEAEADSEAARCPECRLTLTEQA